MLESRQEQLYPLWVVEVVVVVLVVVVYRIGLPRCGFHPRSSALPSSGRAELRAASEAGPPQRS